MRQPCLPSGAERPVSDGEKRCRKCNEWKPLSDFTERRDKQGAYSPACRACDGAKKRSQANRWQTTQRESAVKASKVMKRSPALQAYDTEFQKAKPIVKARSKGVCEAKTDVCSRTAVHVHHRKLRSQGGSNSLVNLIDVCFACHDWIHLNPAISYERGWLLHSTDEETPLR
jgi:hypothetical protein